MFQHAGEKQARLGPASGTEDRLPCRVSVAIVAGLSALSWAFLISAVMGLRAVL